MSVLDWILAVGSIVLMFSQGWWVSRAPQTTDDYFVGGRRMNWLAVGLSLFASSFSPLSFVGMPREAAYVDYHLYVAILFIPLFSAPIVGWLFIPLYHRLQLTSAYEYLELRFDRRLRLGGSFLYVLYTLGWMGSMLFAVGLLVQAALGLSDAQRLATIIVLGAVTTAYTTVGGFKAAVWTNVLKAAVLAGVIVAILVLAVARIDGGWTEVVRIGSEHNKFAMFNPSWSLTRRATFPSACAFGMFVYLAVAVTSQGAVQRYASMPSIAAGRRSLVVNGVAIAAVCLLFFVLGTVMFAFYSQHPPRPELADPKSVFPNLPRQDQLTMHFVRTELPYPGLSGLLLAGLFVTVMGSISSGLSALSALVMCDWLPGRAPSVADSRRMSALFGVATIVMSLLVPYLGEHVFDIIIRISGSLFGPLLGLFLLGSLNPRANTAGASIGFIAGLVSLVVIFPTDIASWWYGALTCLPTLIAGVLGSYLFPPPAPEQVRGLLVFSEWEGAPVQPLAAGEVL